jgi:hypothetical protein
MNVILISILISVTMNYADDNIWQIKLVFK